MRYAPDPVLRTKTQRVRLVNSPSLQKLIDDMIESMRYYEGVGIAANQVGSLQRVAIIQVPEDPEPRVLINLTILRREGEREVEEGCLSIPGYRGVVKRSERVRARALDRHGREVRIRATDLLAQALEHEADHLDGVLYIERLVGRDKLWKLEPVEKGAEASPG
ncbi:MAG: peptide deformylase [Chloroflexi bacterium]|nr:peptide deformylase [Chloroflexota bacterium]